MPNHHVTLSDDAVRAPSSAAARTPLPRGASIRDLEDAGQAVVPVHHPEHANAADVLSVGRALAYRMAEDGRLPTLRLGRRVVVPVSRLRAMLDGSASPS